MGADRCEQGCRFLGACCTRGAPPATLDSVTRRPCERRTRASGRARRCASCRAWRSRKHKWSRGCWSSALSRSFVASAVLAQSFCVANARHHPKLPKRSEPVPTRFRHLKTHLETPSYQCFCSLHPQVPALGCGVAGFPPAVSARAGLGSAWSLAAQHWFQGQQAVQH